MDFERKPNHVYRRWGCDYIDLGEKICWIEALQDESKLENYIDQKRARIKFGKDFAEFLPGHIRARYKRAKKLMQNGVRPEDIKPPLPD